MFNFLPLKVPLRRFSAASRAAALLRHGVLSEASIKKISLAAHSGTQDRTAFDSARSKEESRKGLPGLMTEGATIPVAVPNLPRGSPIPEPLYHVSEISPRKIQEHFKTCADCWVKPSIPLEVLKKFLVLLDRPHVIAQISLWGSKTFSDASGELEEVLGLLEMLSATASASLPPSQSPALTEGLTPPPPCIPNFIGNGKHALVLPATNFPLLALKDAVYLILQGYAVTVAVQPRYFRIYSDLLGCFQQAASDFSTAATNGLRILPLLTRASEPALLEATLHVSALRFTGSSALFKKLVTHAVARGNHSLDFGGEISGINKTLIAESILHPENHPTVVAGTHWSVVANNGELCSSTSVIESELDEKRRKAFSERLFARDRTSGMYGGVGEKLLIRGDKADRIKLEEAAQDGQASSPRVTSSSGKFREYWEKTATFAPLGSAPTHDSLTFCVYAASLREAIEIGTASSASNVYVCAAEEEIDTTVNDQVSYPRVGTTGAKIPESIFGSMKTFTSSVGGNHDGVGTAQWLASLLRTAPGKRGSSFGELPEKIEELLDFLSPDRRAKTLLELAAAYEVFSEFTQPEIHGGYPGQFMAQRNLQDSPVRTSVVSLKAIRSAQKHFILSADSVSEDVVRALAIEAICPFKGSESEIHGNSAAPLNHIHLHVVLDPRTPLLADPLRSFVRFAERSLLHRVHLHPSFEDLSNFVQTSAIAAYFFASPKRSLLPKNFLQIVAERGGFIYESIPSDPLAVFRQWTTSQAWAAGVRPGDEKTARDLLLEIYNRKVLKPGWKTEIVSVQEDWNDAETELDWEDPDDELETAEAEHHGVSGQESR